MLKNTIFGNSGYLQAVPYLRQTRKPTQLELEVTEICKEIKCAIEDSVLDGIFQGEISQLPALNGSAIQGGEEECGELGWLVVVGVGVEKGHSDQQTNCNQPASTTHGKKKNSLQLNWRGIFQAVKARREKRFEQQIYCVRLGKGSIRVGFEKLSWHCHKKTANVSTGTEAFLE